MIIDIHGHYTTAPKSLEAWRDRQIEAIKNPALMPRASELKISDDEIRETIESNQLKKMHQRGTDLTIFSPRASFMAHHIGDFDISSAWHRFATSFAIGWQHSSPISLSAAPCCRKVLVLIRELVSPNWRGV